MSETLRPHVISIRAGDQQGTGDSRRVASLAAAFELAGIDAQFSSLIGPADSLRVLFRGIAGVSSLAGLLPRFLITGLPLQVLLTQKAMSQLTLWAEPNELRIYVTSRVVPINHPGQYVIDFVDSMAENARSSARTGMLLTRAFWRIEARRLKRWEDVIAQRSLLATAVSEDEAATLGPGVECVPIEVERDHSHPPRKRHRSVLFAGSLFYRPNDEAAQWVVRELLPTLVERGWSPDQVIIAGRRPGRKLKKLCHQTGVTLKADVPDLRELMRDAGVILVPLRIGSGVQTKILNAYECQAPLLVTPRANRGINIPASQEQGIIVLPRAPEPWADAIDTLITGEAELGTRTSMLDRYRPDNVRHRWLQLLAPHLGNSHE